jgi:hypothetical protein
MERARRLRSIDVQVFFACPSLHPELILIELALSFGNCSSAETPAKPTRTLSSPGIRVVDADQCFSIWSRLELFGVLY